MPAKRKKIAQKKDPELSKVYAEFRKNFTAADLQKYTEATPTIPFLQLVEEIESLHAKTQLKQKTKSKSPKRKPL